jgi:hypothetical protein
VAVAPYGLIKYSPVHWAGLAVRPEWRRGSYNGEPYSFVIFVGVDFGWVPGAVGTVAGGVAALALVGSTSN